MKRPKAVQKPFISHGEISLSIRSTICVGIILKTPPFLSSKWGRPVTVSQTPHRPMLRSPSTLPPLQKPMWQMCPPDIRTKKRWKE